MEKCFLLGAGASFGYKNSFSNNREQPPSSFDFFSRGSELNLLNAESFPNLNTIVDRYVSEHNIEHMNADIESIMTYAIEELNMGNYGQLTYYIYTLFRHYSKTYNSRGLDNYQRLAKHYRNERYSVISLNYDVIFEQALESRGLTPNYNYQYSRHQVPIAKLHGSINAVNKMPYDYLKFGSEFHDIVDNMYSTEINNILVDRGGETLERPDTSYMTVDQVNKIDHRELLFRSNDHLQIILAPPVGKNKLNSEGTTHVYTELKRVKNYAEEMIADAEELVIIGSSIRENDDDLRTLINENLDEEAKVTLVVGGDSDDVEERIDHPSTNIDNTGMYFGEYALTL
jgi:hypothetical protein